MSTFDSETMNGLAAKLAALELTDNERSALDCILDRAGDADDEVVGFGSFDMSPSSDGFKAQEQKAKVRQPDLSVPGLKIATALGWRP